MKKLDRKIAIVTGSGRGIGQAIALKLASEGAKLVVNDLDAGPAEETVARIRALGSDAVNCVGDVTVPDFGARIVKSALDAFGGIDIIVNNAGYAWDGHRAVPHPARRVRFHSQRSQEGKGRRPWRQPQSGEHLFHRRHVRQCRSDGVFRGKGCHHRHDQDHGQGVGPLPGQRQLRRVRPDPDAHDAARRLRRGSGENRGTRSENGDTT